MSYGSIPARTVAATVFVAGSIRSTVEPRYVMTQTAPAPAVIPHGFEPTGMRATTWFVAGSMRATSSRPKSATHAEPASMATEHGCAPTSILATSSVALVDACAQETTTTEPMIANADLFMAAEDTPISEGKLRCRSFFLVKVGELGAERVLEGVQRAPDVLHRKVEPFVQLHEELVELWVNGAEDAPSLVGQ